MNSDELLSSILGEAPNPMVHGSPPTNPWPGAINKYKQFRENNIVNSLLTPAPIDPSASLRENADAMLERAMNAGVQQIIGIQGAKNLGKDFLDNLKHALLMVGTGNKNARDIFSETGWYQAPWDKKWRTEVPNVLTEISPSAPREKYSAENRIHAAPYGKPVADPERRKQFPLGHEPIPLSDIVSDPILQQAYPEIFNYPIRNVSNINIRGGFSPDTKKFSLGLGSTTDEDILETLIHEIQHAIQQKEGFSHGTNTMAMLPDDVDPNFFKSLMDSIWNKRMEAESDLRQHHPGISIYDFSDYIRSLEAKTYDKWTNRYPERAAKYSKLLLDPLGQKWRQAEKDFQTSGLVEEILAKKYQAAPGEMEARLASLRAQPGRDNAVFPLDDIEMVQPDLNWYLKMKDFGRDRQ